ncbi:MAG: ABC transporter ATP-binding protein, partial [Microbacterium gubbeenense]
MSTNKPANGSLNAVRRTLALARPHLRGQGWIMAGGVAMMLIEVVMRVAEPWPLKIVIDAVTVSLGATEGAAEGQSGASVALLVSCGILLLGFVGVRAIAQYCSTVVFALVGSRVATRLRSRV